MSPAATMVRSAIPNDRLIADDRIDLCIGCHWRKIALHDRRIKHFRLDIAHHVDIGRAIAVASVESSAISGGGILRHADKIGLIITHRPPAMSIIWRGEVLGCRRPRWSEECRPDEYQSPMPGDGV
jgi:hypothetical protein